MSEFLDVREDADGVTVLSYRDPIDFRCICWGEGDESSWLTLDPESEDGMTTCPQCGRTYRVMMQVRERE